jgi:hypothetical protein
MLARCSAMMMMMMMMRDEFFGAENVVKIWTLKKEEKIRA